MTTDQSDFDLVQSSDSMDFLITDLVLLNKKEKCPPDYVVVEPAIADTGRLLSSKRYLAYCRKVPSPRLGRVVVTEVKIISSAEPTPFGYQALSQTYDENVKPFSQKTVVIKIVPLEEARQALNDVVVLSGSKKENVPTGYQRLPEINGFSVCYKTGAVNQKPQSKATPQQSQEGARTSKPGPVTRQNTLTQKTSRTAIDGLVFKLNDSSDVTRHLNEFLLTNLNILSLDDIEKKFTFDWTLAEEQSSQ